MALLDEIIDGASDPSVSTANLLRKASVVAHRMQAKELESWIKHELNGFRGVEDALIPSYRGPFQTPVRGKYSGPAGSGANNVPLDTFDVEEWFLARFFTVIMREPVSELEQLSSGPTDPVIVWPPRAVGTWNDWEDQGKVAGMQYMSLIAAQQVITRTFVLGAIDSVRNQLLDFALELQSANPEIGEPGGPTVSDPAVGKSAETVVMNIFGTGANVAVGQNATQTSSIAVNDLGALINAAQALGITDAAALTELTQAATAADHDKPSRLRAFIDKVGAGVFTLAANVSTKVATEGLNHLANQYLGLK